MPPHVAERRAEPELRLRAQGWLEELAKKQDEERKQLGVEDALAQVPGLNMNLLVQLGRKGIKKLDDLADLASDELIELLGKDTLDEDEANTIIMAARAHWFPEESAGDTAGEPAADAPAPGPQA